MATAYNPQIITSGLVFCLDAASPKSYPGSGSLWSDLSNQGNNGELVNSPIYNSSNLGYFQFVSDKFAKIQNNTVLDTQTPTVEVWIKTNATTQNGFWFEKGNVNTQYSLFQEGSFIRWRQRLTNSSLVSLSITTSDFINTSNWYQVVATFVSGSRRLYINGIQVNFDTLSGTLATDTGGMSIGVYGGFDGNRSYYYNGNLAVCRVYNRVLSPSEIRQNFNATKSRFNL